MRMYGGDCIDVVCAFDGSSGTGDAYKAGLMTKDPCCYPSAKGQQLMAQLLYRLGLGPPRADGTLSFRLLRASNRQAIYPH